MVSTLNREKTSLSWEKLKERITIYLAGPLFGIADRHHNWCLANALGNRGFSVILPQEEAAKFFDGKRFDLDAICEDCAQKSASCQVILLNLDGPDADSGTSIEGGIALYLKIIAKEKIPERPLVIGVRTDFRTVIEREVGMNAMFRLADKIIYYPAFVGSLGEVETFYHNLAHEIDLTMWKLLT